MKDIIYLTMDAYGVQSMRKSYTGCKKGEIIVKLNVDVAKDAFQPPVIEQFVQIKDWSEGVSVDDVKFERNVITEEEAEHIRAKRLEKMKQILEEQGFKVEAPEEE